MKYIYLRFLLVHLQKCSLDTSSHSREESRFEPSPPWEANKEVMWQCNICKLASDKNTGTKEVKLCNTTIDKYY